ncbi:hypothetical protein VTH06DRAFT_8258 [Thermothelomyces fergusii]
MPAQFHGSAGPPTARILTITKLHTTCAVHSLLFLFLLTTTPPSNSIGTSDDRAPIPAQITSSAFQTAPVTALAYCLHLWCAALGIAWWCATQCGEDDARLRISHRRDDGEEKDREEGGKRRSVGRAAELADGWEPAIFRVLCAGLLGALSGHAMLAGWYLSEAAKEPAAAAGVGGCSGSIELAARMHKGIDWNAK